MSDLHVYIAGKVSKDSVFGTHYWRDDFCHELERLSGLKINNLDPTKNGVQEQEPSVIFGADAWLINQSNVLIVYLSDDISVGGSQEILIAKYFNKPVIGLAPRGGKFNGSRKEHFGKIIEDYKDPFVFATCDVVCATVEEVAIALQNINTMPVKSISIIKEYMDIYKRLAS